MDFFWGFFPFFPWKACKYARQHRHMETVGREGERQAILSKMCDTVGVVPTLADSQHFLLFFLLFASS